jgi:DNA-binding NarL/FixJ family response regulator
MRSFRILVVDDHEVVRLGIRAMLEGHAGWEVCDEAADGREGVDKAAQIRPDLVILDLNMPRLNGLGAARQMLRNESRPQILVLMDSYSERAMREALEIGVRGVLLKSDPGSDLLAAIEALQTGRTFFTSGLADLLLDGYLTGGCERSNEDPSAPGLTIREREVVQLLAEGSSTKEVAKVLGLSVKTAETHRSNLMRKVRVHSLSELVLYAVRNGIVSVANSQECGLTPAPMSRGCTAALERSAVQCGVTAVNLSAALM